MSSSSRQLWRLVARQSRALLFVTTLLGVSVGAAAALFGLMHAFVLDPVPGVEPERVIHAMGLSFRPGGESGLAAWRTPGLERLATYVSGLVEVENDQSWRAVRASVVSSELFAVFGVTPAIGRDFRDTNHDTAPFGSAPIGTAIISHAFWRGFAAGSPAVVGQRLRFSGHEYLIVGIAPPGFDYPSGTEVWLAGLVGGPAARSLRNQPPPLFATGPAAGWVARLRTAVSVQQGAEQLRTRHASLKQQLPTAQLGDTIRVRALRDLLSQEIRPALALFFAGSIAVVLIASVNGGILFTVLLAARMRDVAIMRALGATPSTLLGMMARALGLVWASTATMAIVVALLMLRTIDLYSPLFAIHTPQPSALAGAMTLAVLALATGAVGVAALMPCIQLPRTNVAGFLQGRAVAPRTRFDTPRRHVFTSVQVALSVLLMLIALLSTRTLLRLERQELGFEPDEALVVETRIPETASDASAERQRELLRTIAAVPGVRAVGASSDLPLSAARTGLWLERGHARLFCGRYLTTGGYLPAMGIPLIAGRAVEDGERGVVVIGERAARRLWPERQGRAVGESLWLTDEKRAVQVVGVAKDTPPLDLARAEASCQIYLPYGELSEGTRASVTPVVVRCAGRCTEGTVAALRQRLADRSRSSAGEVVTLKSVVDRAMHPTRFRASLSLLYAVFGALLAMLGTYALISQMALQRRGEVGLRATLGARPWQLVTLLTGRSLIATALGAAAGALAAIALSRLVTSLVFGVDAVDIVAIVAAASVLMICGSLAAMAPAVRLARRAPGELIAAIRDSGA